MATIIPNSAKTYSARKQMALAVGADMKDVGLYLVEPGDAEPVLSGERESWHYETKGGRYIHHPSAYSRFGWSNMVYCMASRYEITCGIGWLRQHSPAVGLVEVTLT